MDGSPSCLITRVEESNSKLLESEKKLQEERQRTVVLEQHLEKMRLEPGRTSVCQRAAPRSKAGRGWPRAPSPQGVALPLTGEPASGNHFSPVQKHGGAEASIGAELGLPLLLGVFFPRPPLQSQEPQKAIGPRGSDPAHL